MIVYLVLCGRFDYLKMNKVDNKLDLLSLTKSPQIVKIRLFHSVLVIYLTLNKLFNHSKMNMLKSEMASILSRLGGRT